MTKKKPLFDVSEVEKEFLLIEEGCNQLLKTLDVVDMSGEKVKIKKGSKQHLEFKEMADSVTQFKKQGYRFARRGEAWAALYALGEYLEQDKNCDARLRLWILEALNRTTYDDAASLNRELGLVELGRSRVVDKFKVSDRMAELIGEGMVKEHAALQVAKEFGCSRATALHWFRKRTELYPAN